jgi:hypothetical protein
MPTLTVSIQPETKVLIDALSTLLQAPPARVVDLAVAAYVENLGTSEKQAVASLRKAAIDRLNSAVATRGREAARPESTYEFSRLCFKRDVIEALAPQDAFRVVTPVGTFQMTKADFQRVFSNVAESRSYLEDGIYHYPKLPSRAEEFRVK